jgi:hypothetical protein
MRRAWLGCLLLAMAGQIGCQNNVMILPIDSGVNGGFDLGHAPASTDLAGADLYSNGTTGPLPPPSGPETGTFADFAAKLAAASCAHDERCGFFGVSEDASCRVGQLAGIVSPPSYSIDDSINAGRATLDATASQACLSALDAAGCGFRDSYNVNAACSGYIKGTVMNGVGCRSSLECATGFCAAVAEGCAGTCKGFATAGFSCANALCDAASYCNADNSVCVALPTTNQACNLNGLSCQAGLVCHNVDSSGDNGTCGAVAKSGAACTYSGDCDVGLYCDPGTSPGKCAPLLQSGATCTAYDACQAPFDCIGLTAPGGTSTGSTGKCAAWLDIGKTCDPAAGVTGCPFYSVCNAVSKICTAISTEGYACTTSNDCRADLYCNAAGFCAKEVVYGAVCDPDDGAVDQCLSGSCDPTSNACLTFCS